MKIYRLLKEYVGTGGVIIEIGAHIGTDTVKLYDVLEPARYFAIEADHRNIDRLFQNVGQREVIVANRAIGDSDSSAKFYYSGDRRGHREYTDSSSLMPPKDNVKLRPWMTFIEGAINCQRLDTFCKWHNIERVDLIWMDVQGAELLVFAGGLGTLKHTRFIYTECQENRYHGQPGIKGIMKALPGWEVVLMNGDNVLLKGNNGAANDIH